MNDVLVSVLTGMVGVGGGWWWIRSHSHPELVSRRELSPQLDMILAELRYLRERLDRTPPSPF